MDRIKNIILSRKFLLWAIFLVTLLIIFGLIWLIYHKDQPKIIPPETRGKIREGVKEEVVKPVQSVLPGVGNAISNAVYNASPHANSSNAPSSNLKTYKNEQYGFEFSYPDRYMSETSEVGTIIATGEAIEEIKAAQIKYQDTDFPFWGGKSILLTEERENSIDIYNYVLSSFDKEGVLIQEKEVNGKTLYYVEDRGPNRFGGGTGYYYFFLSDGKVFCLGADFYLNQTIDSKIVADLNNAINSLQIK